MQDIWLFIQAHESLALALLVVLVLLIILELMKLKHGPKRLTPAQVTMLINHDNAVIVDMRSTDLFANGHIVNAISLPLNELAEKYRKLEKFKSQSIVVICAADTEASRALKVLQQYGFEKTSFLQNGIRAWRDADLPLVKGS